MVGLAFLFVRLATAEDFAVVLVLVVEDRVIINPLSTIRSRPTSRLRPCATLFVAIRPRVPDFTVSVVALRKKYVTKSALPRWPAATWFTSQSRMFVPTAPVMPDPPRKGGLPMIASKPPRSITSGTAMIQCSGFHRW